MPRVRRGPNGPRKGAAGKKGTNRRTKHKGAGVSGNSHNSQLITRRGSGY